MHCADAAQSCRTHVSFQPTPLVKQGCMGEPEIVARPVSEAAYAAGPMHSVLLGSFPFVPQSLASRQGVSTCQPSSS